MNEHRPAGFANLVIPQLHIPEPVSLDGWWRATWRFTVTETADVTTFQIPVPPSDFAGATVVVQLVERTSEVVVETFDRRGPEFAGDVITYLSLIALGLKTSSVSGSLAVVGSTTPLFTVSREPSGQAD